MTSVNSDDMNPTGLRIPASHITPEVDLVMKSAPYQPVDWDARGTIAERFETATWAQLKLLASGIGDPHE